MQVKLVTQDSAESHGKKRGDYTGKLGVVLVIAFLVFLFANLFLSFLSHVESPFSFPLTWLSPIWGELNLGGRHGPVCDLTEQAV